MRYEMKYGTEIKSVEIPEENVLQVILPSDVPSNTDQKRIVREALDHPVGTGKMEDIFGAKDTVTIVTSDITRPLPSYTVLPPVVEELHKIGIKDEQITIMFAIGSHRHHTEEEMAKLVGKDLYDRIRCVDSDPEKCALIGTTESGTPIEIDERLLKTDRIICLGNVEYHYFAGYSGGIKAIFPGCATRATIQNNHRHMVEPGAVAGNLRHNPVRDDLEEILKLIKVDFIVNVVLNPRKEVIYAAAGDVIEAHRDACAYLDSIYHVDIHEKADIVIASQGGSPKDLNLYQTQKALDNTKYAIKDGGVIILVGSCKEGFGESHFEEWMLKYDADEMIHHIRENFILGAHKAAAIALVKKQADIYLLSDFPEEIVRKTFLEPVHDLQEAYKKAQEKFGGKGTVILMPYAGSTLPCLKE